MRALVVSLALIAATLPAFAAPAAPPNLTPIDAKLTTSGQPSAEWLSTLKDQGYEAVIYLAPPTVEDAVREEPLIVGRQGLVWINLPIRWNAPADADYDTFAALLQSLRGKKVLVHCQVNFRASTLTFLYRVLVEKTDPQVAWESVSKVWTPSGAWKTLMLDRLKKNGVAFDPF
ncbi:protein tyrosine phosphatase family protein [Burkholderiaceae bacterium UC74_6]